jgi:hypothetical protein
VIVYKPAQLSRHVVFVTPANMAGVDSSEFRNADGSAQLFPVTFEGGRAKVPDNLGQFMIDNDMARFSPVLLPDDIQMELAHAR